MTTNKKTSDELFEEMTAAQASGKYTEDQLDAMMDAYLDAVLSEGPKK